MVQGTRITHVRPSIRYLQTFSKIHSQNLSSAIQGVSDLENKKALKFV